MARNIMILCDGTGNEIEENHSNVLKLYRCLRKSAQQVVFYDPGIGTISQPDNWSQIRSKAKGVFGLATGQGLDKNVLEAYKFLMDHYRKGDNVFLFGFSRGAYTARVLAGFIHMVGLLKPEQKNLCDYAFVGYKAASAKNNLDIGWQFQRVLSTESPVIRFLGVWDTVNSVLVPRRDRMYVPSLQQLPYTLQNPSVEVFRHAMAIDERRRMFRVSHWDEPQDFVANRFDKNAQPTPQDIKQVWFSGVHSDVGGGYPEVKSALAKFPLYWMIREAESAGAKFHMPTVRRIALGQNPKGVKHQYVAPDSGGEMNDSMSTGWRILEYIPKLSRLRESRKQGGSAPLYLPRSEARFIGAGALVHQSVVDRWNGANDYRPSNLPPLDECRVEPWPDPEPAASDDAPGSET